MCRHPFEVRWILWAYGLVWAVAITLRILFTFFGEVPIGGDASHYLEIADEIREHHRFALNEQITAHRPPFYPFFLAAIESMSENLTLVRFLQALLSVGVIGFMASLLDVHEKRNEARLSFLALGALSPAWIYYPATILSETLFGFLTLLALWMVSREPVGVRNPKIGTCLMAGGLLGLATLTRSVTLLLPPFLLVAAALSRSRRAALKPLSILTIAWGLTILPWTIRNAVQFEAFVPVNTMGGIVLWQGANPSTEGFGFTPWSEIDEAAGTRDEVQRNRVLTQKALGAYAEDPLRTLRLAALKFIWFWNPWDGDTFSLGSPFNPHTFLVILLAGYHLFTRLRERRRTSEENTLSGWLHGWVLMYFLLMALVFYGSPRFRMPIEPALWYFSALGFADLMKLDRRHREVAIGVIVGSTLFLYLARDWPKDFLRDVVDSVFGYREFWGEGTH